MASIPIKDVLIFFTGTAIYKNEGNNDLSLSADHIRRMPSIVWYGGVKYLLTRHAVYCKGCKDTIESKHDRDFKICGCGLIGIDGGISNGNRILGDPSIIEDRSIYTAFVNGKKVYLQPV